MAQTRIMVVEDETVVAKDIVQRLKSLGYEVPAMAANGEDAVKKALKLQPDLILMDIKLKGEMTGIEAAERIRAYHDIPIIYLTAYADSDTLEGAKITGPFGYILKPFEERELRTAIEIAIYKHKMENALRQSEQWLNTTLKSIGEAVIACDVKSRVTFMNPIAESLTGWKQEEAFGKELNEVFNIVNENSDDKNANPVARVLAEGVIVGLANHSVLIGKDGRRIPIDDNAAPIKNEKGSVTGVVLVFRDVSERKRAEGELKAGKERYKKLVGSVTDYIYTVDIKNGLPLRTTHAPGCITVTGYWPDEFEKNPFLWHEMVHADDKPIVEERANKSARGEVVAPFEHRIIHKDGSERWVRNTQVPRFDTNNNLVAYDGLVSDVTERKQAEERLAASENRLRTIVEAEPECVKVIAPDGTLVSMNPAGLRMIEADSPEQVIGKSVYPLIVPEHRRAFQDLTERVCKGTEGTLQFEIVGMKGTRRWLETHAVPFRDEAGHVSGNLGITRDITERKKAEEALAEREKRYSALFNLSPSGIVLEDIEGNIVDVNEAFCKSLGYTREELVGKNVRMVASPDQIPIIEHHIAKLRSGKMLEHVIHDVRKDGTLCWMELHETSITLANGRQGFLVVAHDITERKQAERELLHSKRFTENIVATVPSGLLVIGGESEVISVNRSFCVLFNLRRQEVVGQPVDAVLETIGLSEECRTAIAARSPFRNLECSCSTPTRGTLSLNLSLSGIRLAEEEEEEEALLVIEDITERKQAEENRRRIERIVDKSQVVLFHWLSEPGWPVLFVSEGISQFGYTADDFYSRRLDYAQIIYPQDLPRVGDEVKDYLESRTDRFTQEYRIVTKSGDVRCLDDRTLVVRDQSGNIEHIEGTILDITERKRAEEENRLLLTLIHAITEAEDFNSALAVALRMVCETTMWEFGEAWIPSRDGTYLKCNPSWYSSFQNAGMFRTASERFKFAPSVGLPGRVWASKKPEWIPDVTVNGSFPRAPFAKEVGFHAAIGIPILVGKDVIAVIAFFLHEVRQEDKRMVALVSAVAGELGTLFQRKQAEERLLKSEERHRDLFESTSDLIQVATPEGRLLYTNRAWREILGYTQEEVARLSLQEIVHSDHQAKCFATLSRARSGEKINQLETIFLTKEGKSVTVEGSIVCRFELGKPSTLTCFLRDITERKRAEEALLESEERYRRLVEISPDAIAVHCEGKIVFVNSAAVRSLGAMRPDDLIGKPALEIVHPDDREMVKQRIAEMLRGGKSVPIVEERFLRIDGGVIDVEVAAVATTHQNKPAVQVIVRDITERKRAEERLRQSEGRYRALFEKNPLPMWLSDLQTLSILAVNQATIDHYGYTREEFLSMTIKDIRPPEDVPLFLDYLAQTADATRNPGVWRHRKKDGTIIWVSVASENFLYEGKSVRLALLNDVTEEKRAQEALRESEEKYRGLIDNMNEGIFVTDTKGMLTFANNALARIHGYDNPEQLVSRYFAEFIEPSMRDEIAQRFRNSMQHVGIENFIEAPLIKADGSTAYIQIRPTLVRKGERIVGSMGIVQDITGRKRSEEQLRKLSVAVEQSPVTILITDTKGIIEYVNPKFIRVSGYTLEETRGKSVRILKSGETSPEAYKNLWETIAAGGEWRGEFHNRKKNGEMYWDFATISPIIDDVGVITHFLSVQEDITDRKQMVEDLMESEERYRRFFEDDLTGDSISTVDGKLLSCNPAFAHIYGFDSVEEVMKSNMNSFYASPRHRDAFVNLVREKRKLAYYEEEGRRKDGKAIYLISNNIGIFNEKDELVQIKGYIFDNTERQLLEEQLRQSQKMESLGALAGGIAHDFNNILNNILGFTMQLKKYSHEPVKVLKYSETIEKSASRGAQLSAHLLSVSRRKPLENVEIDVAQVIYEITTLCAETFPPSIAVEKEIAPGLLDVKGDHSSLYQVLLNLTVNARDAMPNGGTLTIQAKNRRVGDEVNPKLFPLNIEQCIELSVSDTGIGMSDAVREKSFEPFFTTKEQGKGTGLGLSVVYNIVKDYHGAILVESDEGVGSRFTVYLPTIKTHAGDANSANESSGAASSRRPDPLGGQLVLLADDEEGMQELGRELLEDNGFKVIIAKDGVEALEIYRQRGNEIALVILDLVMPRMDGGQTYMELKKLNNNVKAFFCSGFTSDKVITQLLEEENLCAIQKPFHSSDFLKMVHTTLKGK